MGSYTPTSENTITVLGAGYVGLTTAALFANAGFKVYAVEPNPERLQVIQSGKSFFYEAGLDALIQRGLETGLLTPTASYEESVPQSSIVFSCVGTPDNADGSSNLEYIFSAAKSRAELAQPGTIFVQKSTVPVGTAQSVMTLFKDLDADLHYVSNPEFLREGTALEDTLFFDRIVIGGKGNAVKIVERLYRQLEKHRENLAKLASLTAGRKNGTYIITSLESAELTKVTSNAFLALKISFANSVAQLADASGADIIEVMNAVGSDKRIGKAFLNAGRGYGGGCFPKDVRGLIASSDQFGVNFGIMKEAQAVNDSMPAYIIDKTEKEFGESFEGKNVAILGLAFKANTSDTRKSPGIKIANLLTELGARVCAYDPKANDEARHELRDTIAIEESLASALGNSEIIFITTNWNEFLDIDFNTLSMKQPLMIVDAVNMLNPNGYKSGKIRYIGVGR